MTRMRAHDRRRQLLEVAADLFARLGYRGTTTAKLAQAAGITEPILYRHFENKHHLFVTLIDEVSREVIANWQESLSGIHDPHERLIALLSRNPATHARGKGVYRVIFQAMTEVEGDPELIKPIRRHLSKLNEFIAAEVFELQQAGAVRDDQSPEQVAWLLIIVAVGYGMILPLSLRPQPEILSKGGMQQLLAQIVAPVAV